MNYSQSPCDIVRTGERAVSLLFRSIIYHQLRKHETKPMCIHSTRQQTQQLVERTSTRTSTRTRVLFPVSLCVHGVE